MSSQTNDTRKSTDTGKGHNQNCQKTNEDETRGKITKMMESIHCERLQRLYDFTYRIFLKS